MENFEQLDKEKYILDLLRTKGIDERLLSNPSFIEDYVKNIEKIVENEIKFRREIDADYKSPLEIFKEYVRVHIENAELNTNKLETSNNFYGEKRETYTIKEDGSYEYIEYSSKEIEQEYSKDNEEGVNINPYNDGVINIEPPSFEISIEESDYIGEPGGEVYIGNAGGAVNIGHTKQEKRIENKITSIYDANGIEQKKEIKNIKVYDETKDGNYEFVDSESTVIIATRKEDSIHYEIKKTDITNPLEPVEYEEVIGEESEKRINISSELLDELYDAKSLKEILEIKEKFHTIKAPTPTQIADGISPKISDIKEVASEMVQGQTKEVGKDIDNNHDDNDDK